MSDENNVPENQPETEVESTGNAALDKQLAQGAVDFDRGIDTAQVVISAFLILIVGLVALLGVTAIPFQGVESDLIVNNTPLHRVLTAPAAFSGVSGTPLTLLGLAANWQITPNWAPGFRAVTLLLHLLNGILLYLVARRLFGPGLPEPVAMLAGVLFVVHPLAGESAACLAGRSGIQALFFLLLAVLTFLRYTEAPAHAGRLLFMLAAYGLAFVSDASAAFLPVWLLAADALRNGREGVRQRAGVHALLLATSLGVVVAYAAANSAAIERTAGATAFIASLSHELREFLVNTFLPVRFNPLPDAGLPVLATATLIPLLAFVAAIVALLIGRSPALLAVLWPFAALCAAVALPAGPNALPDAHGYLPLAGLALAATWIIGGLASQRVRVMAGLAAAAAVIVLALLTWQRVAVWAEPELFWNNVAETAPDAAEPWRYLARDAQAQSARATNQEEALTRLSRAELYWRETLRRAPEDAEAVSSLGKTLRYLGRTEDALLQLSTAFRLRPFDASIALQLAFSFEEQARTALLARLPELSAAMSDSDAELQRLERALRGRPWAGNEAMDLTLLYETADRLGQDIEPLRQAAQYFARARALAPLDAEAACCYGGVLAGLGNAETSAALFNEAARLDPNEANKALAKRGADILRQAAVLDQTAETQFTSPTGMFDGLQRRAEAAATRGQWRLAGYALEQVLGHDAANAPAWTALGMLRGYTGATEQFLTMHGADAAATPDQWRVLAGRCAAAGLWEVANTYIAAGPGKGDDLQRLLTLGETAQKLKRPRKALAYLAEAAKLRPDDPSPHLRTFDVVFESGDLEGAARALAEAERLGAWPEELENRKKQLQEKGGTPVTPVAPAAPEAPNMPERTVIR